MPVCDNCGGREFETEYEQYFCVRCGSQLIGKIILNEKEIKSDPVCVAKKLDSLPNPSSIGDDKPVIAAVSLLLRIQCDQLVKEFKLPADFRLVVFNIFSRAINELGVLNNDRMKKADLRLFYRKDQALNGICKKSNRPEELKLLVAQSRCERDDFGDSTDDDCDLANDSGVSTQTDTTIDQWIFAGKTLWDANQATPLRLGMRHTIAILFLSMALLNLPVYCFHLLDMIRDKRLCYLDIDEIISRRSYADRTIFETRRLVNEGETITLAGQIAHVIGVQLPVADTVSVARALPVLQSYLCLPFEMVDFCRKACLMCPPAGFVQGHRRTKSTTLEIVPIALAYIALWFSVHFGEPDDGRWDHMSAVARIINKRLAPGQRKCFVVNDWVRFIEERAELRRPLRSAEQMNKKNKLSQLHSESLMPTSRMRYCDKFRSICQQNLQTLKDPVGRPATMYPADTTMACFRDDGAMWKAVADSLDKDELPFVRVAERVLLRRHADVRLLSMNRKKGSLHQHRVFNAMCDYVGSELSEARFYYLQIWMLFNERHCR